MEDAKFSRDHFKRIDVICWQAIALVELGREQEASDLLDSVRRGAEHCSLGGKRAQCTVTFLEAKAKLSKRSGHVQRARVLLDQAFGIAVKSLGSGSRKAKEVDTLLKNLDDTSSRTSSGDQARPASQGFLRGLNAVGTGIAVGLNVVGTGIAVGLVLVSCYVICSENRRESKIVNVMPKANADPHNLVLSGIRRGLFLVGGLVHFVERPGVTRCVSAPAFLTALPDILSQGSAKHPLCDEACRFHRKGLCKLGQQCPQCHVDGCQQTRKKPGSKERARERDSTQ